METATIQTLRDGVARDVMGWHSGPIPWAYDGTALLWHDTDGTPLLTVHSWQPDENDAQCMQVLDRMLALEFGLHMDCDAHGCQVCFTHAARPDAKAQHAERRLALLHAALAAFSDSPSE